MTMPESTQTLTHRSADKKENKNWILDSDPDRDHKSQFKSTLRTYPSGNPMLC